MSTALAEKGSPMTSSPPHDEPHPGGARKASHPLHTIQDIREALPEDQRRHFEAELAKTEIDALPEMLHRWITLGFDGFEEFLLSTPFEGLEFGARSYDEPKWDQEQEQSK
ncbi:hypothetical protein ADL29_02635 [Streptomyces chattanoogensis]|uniref:Uncharacterized protein n=2 Tax=Streptomyces chattanoogensis TaxID=66876 RepID=A0A0N0H4Q6_9ACTN|nr:hypothetical protein ADL29_02635 [Streptomyces chattanoogensis]